jgi:hypothetical protein
MSSALRPRDAAARGRFATRAPAVTTSAQATDARVGQSVKGAHYVRGKPTAVESTSELRKTRAGVDAFLQQLTRQLAGIPFDATPRVLSRYGVRVKK